MNEDTCSWKYGNLKSQNEQELQNSHIYYNFIHFEVTLWNITTSYCQLQGTNRFETYPISYQNFIHSNKSRVVVFTSKPFKRTIWKQVQTSRVNISRFLWMSLLSNVLLILNFIWNNIWTVYSTLGSCLIWEHPVSCIIKVYLLSLSFIGMFEFTLNKIWTR